ncbi:MAG: hypothetical protein KF749_04285 [Bacteroidetes bacterium]|nr:hypothetical protein [Bacteroidota bacterium]MCW5897595.1 hypothetical protein [Bacteroidota bacterium]
MTRALVFPKGVRFPVADEIPNNDLKVSLLDRIASADIREGYVLATSENPNYPYYAEINVSAPQVWKVFKDLSHQLLPEEVGTILGEKDQEKDQLFLGPYSSREALLNILGKYEFELANDGFIQFGLIHQVEGKTEEVFVEPSKHFCIWTSNDMSFRNAMQVHDIPEQDKLSFIDEYPRVTLAEYEGATRHHWEVLKELKELCVQLSQR